MKVSASQVSVSNLLVAIRPFHFKYNTHKTERSRLLTSNFNLHVLATVYQSYHFLKEKNPTHALITTSSMTSFPLATILTTSAPLIDASTTLVISPKSKGVLSARRALNKIVMVKDALK